jgi:hypothetical protein
MPEWHIIECVIALACKAVEAPLEYPTTALLGERNGAIGTVGIKDYDIVAPRQRVEATRKIPLLIQR